VEDSTKAKLERLEALREEAGHQGSEKAVARQRERGKLLARERLEVSSTPAPSSSSTATCATATRSSG